MWGPEIIVNRLTPAWRFFPSKRALDYLRGYAAQASSGELGGRWRAGARAVELGGGELGCALPLLQKQDDLRADQRLGANLVAPHPRGNPHDSTGAGKVW